MKRFSEPVKIKTKEVYKDAPGLNWEVSEQTKKELAELDEYIKKSAMQLHLLRF